MNEGLSQQERATQPGATEDARFMARALELAGRARGRTAPNPLVGCVIVRNDQIIGEGWHERAGEPHAEARALAAAGEASGATAYVTLEPCSHHGRTPPCADALIEAGIARVVVATGDPDPRVNGQGLEKLRAAGISVDVGLLEEQARTQNQAFFTAKEQGRPLVLYKTAMTLDGKIATRNGHSRWITGERARAMVQRWRDELDAVAVGVGTVLLDDPRLTCRLREGRSPLKVVFDSAARTPSDAKLFEDDPQGQPARVVIYVTEQAPEARRRALQDRGADVMVLPSRQGRGDVRCALTDLLQRGVHSVLLEGGGTVAWSFFEARAVDRVAVFISPKLLGGNGKSPLGGLGVASMADAIELAGAHSEPVGRDLLVTGRVVYPPSLSDAA